MLNEQTFDKLYAMKLIGMAEGFKEQLEQPSFRDLSFEERFGMLVDRQWTWKENKRLKRLLQEAKLKLQASPEDIDYRTPSRNRKIRDPQSHLLSVDPEPSESPHLGSYRRGQNLPGLCLCSEGLSGRLPHPLPPLPSVLLPDRSGPSRWQLWHPDEKALQNSSPGSGRSGLSSSHGYRTERSAGSDRRPNGEHLHPHHQSAPRLIIGMIISGTRPSPMPLWIG